VTRNYLQLTRLGIDTYQEPVVYMREDCHVCRSEGFRAQSRVRVSSGEHSIICTLDVVRGDFLSHRKAGLSEAAWHLLGASEGDRATFSHPVPVESMSHVRGKLYGLRYTETGAQQIIADIAGGRYSDIQLSAYVTSCAASSLDVDETIAITRAMVDVGRRFEWQLPGPVLDKHCVGGLPGNRTTPIVVAIIAANGLVIPKTSSRAITSPAGTADTMETLTTVTLDHQRMREVVLEQGACLAWGGSVSLSPTDDIIIRVERALDLDSEGQLVASVISKKVAAGSTHVLLDIPVGPTAKVRSQALAERLSGLLKQTGEALGLQVRTLISDGSQPVGRGIGPALEARDVMAVLRNEPQAPADLRERALTLAAALLTMGGHATKDEEALKLARQTLESGRALTRFEAICRAQGGLKEPPMAAHQHTLTADQGGVVVAVNNRIVSRLASLAGAPGDPAAGLEIHVRTGDLVVPGQPLITLHAESPGELEYALEFHAAHRGILHIDPEGAV
jgi:thymidine phosphorylase